MQNPIRIYVACLAAYNNGILHGRWIDATEDVDHIWKETKAMLAVSPIERAEEWAVHDFEGFEGLYISEYTSFETIAGLAAFIEEHGEMGAKLIEHMGGDKDSAETALQDHYIGQYESVADYAQELTEDMTDIPESLIYYIDYEKMARDMTINDLIVIETGYREQHLFWGF